MKGKKDKSYRNPSKNRGLSGSGGDKKGGGKKGSSGHKY